MRQRGDFREGDDREERVVHAHNYIAAWMQVDDGQLRLGLSIVQDSDSSHGSVGRGLLEYGVLFQPGRGCFEQGLF